MKKVILGTDWWTDCDDAVALRIITKKIKEKEIELLGVVIHACMEYSASSLEGFLLKDGIKNVPIGLDFEATDFGGNPPFQKRLSVYSEKHKDNSSAVPATRLYRKLLSDAEEKVEIFEIGFMQAFAALLQSPPDDISSKSGMELVSEKVEKIWVMAGKWDKDGECEHNFCLNERSRKAGEYFCKNCPVPVTFLGFEVGKTVISGGNLPEGDHLLDVLRDRRSENGRSSWDPMLVLLGLIGDEEKAGYETVRGFASVDAETGANFFRRDELGAHIYVVKKFPDEFYRDMINEIII